ncbi:1-propanol dehydrogenase PduQ [Neobacillus sp. OS1-32]|uniref:1-propanol dehydrogenase PduQ n=1 Tax=Neobacillus sp. OS1-32 TaxID=3070682 RepID=UPI0027E1D02A|nr:1-propanol dehydrogenase PduQ [Neobacillus sp. OS1-32]WML28981.1 1-propanol dehydrogenase PduQ [Neobacillus sp. OS1-32]
MEEISLRTKLNIGANSLDSLLKITGQKVFIIADPFIVQSGIVSEVTNRLHSNHNEYLIFNDIIPDPPIETVTMGVKALQEFYPSVLIAIGGGSAIDTAKAIKEFSIRLFKQENDLKFIAIPTTSGTGSEVTSFSVITDQEKHVKYPLVADSLLPDEAILDPNLVISVPPAITADTGLDVLTHALEAYVSTNANDFSDALAEKAFQLIFDYLLRCYNNGKDIEAREKIHHASCLAGMAFNIAGLGVNHGIAHACGAQFHIPHGRMNAILLTAVIEYNADLKGFSNSTQTLTAQKYAQLAKKNGFSSSNIRSGVTSLIQHIQQLKKDLNMPQNLRACGLTYEQLMKSLETITEAALKDGCTKANPRLPTTNDIEAIVKQIF